MKRRIFMKLVAGVVSALGLGPKQLAQKTVVLENPDIYNRMNWKDRQGNSALARLLRMKEKFLTIEKITYSAGNKIVQRIPMTMAHILAANLNKYQRFINSYVTIRHIMCAEDASDAELQEAFKAMRVAAQYAQAAFDGKAWKFNFDEIEAMNRKALDSCIPVDTIQWYNPTFEDWKNNLDNEVLNQHKDD